jgi:flagellar hook-associated protein 3 FlgL
MVNTRVSSAGIHHNTLSDALRVQSKLAKTQGQVSSGLKSQDFQGLSGQVETFVQMEGKMKKTNTFIQTNTVVLSRLQTTEVVMEQIIDISDDFKNLLMTRNNAASGPSAQFAVSAKALMKSLGSQLNTSQEGRFLFGGTKTDLPPVVDPIPANVQENYDVDYGVRANDPAFQKLVAAMNLGLAADGANSSEQLSQATAMLASALEEIVALRAEVQQNVVNITDINERHTQLNLYWKGYTESIAKTDLTAAAIDISMDQAILQASFQTFSTITSLKLTDYLR